MSRKKQYVNEMKKGDFFNETDGDEMWVITEIFSERKPPVCVCATMKKEGEDEETEEEWAMEYVRKCVAQRKRFMDKGYHTLDVYEIYKLSVDELKQALAFAKQTVHASMTKDDLRKRFCMYRNIVEIPSDVTSGSETECEAELVAVSSSSSTEESSSEEEYQPTPKKKAKKKASTSQKNKKQNNESSASANPEEKDDPPPIFLEEEEDSAYEDSSEDADSETEEEEGPANSSSAAAATRSSKNGGKKRRGSRRSKKTTKRQRKTRKRKANTRKRKAKKKKQGKHYAEWSKMHVACEAMARALPEHTWRDSALPRNATKVCVHVFFMLMM